MRRILIITTNFFPYPAVGSVRVTNWARMLPDVGWRPVIACRDYGYRASRELLDREVHPDALVYQIDSSGARVEMPGTGDGVAPAKKPAGAKHSLPARAKRAAALAVNKFVVPDGQRLFWSRAMPELRRIAAEVRPDVILSSSPPHSVHFAGMRLTAETGLPWIADYRDPHLLDERFQPAGLAKLAWPAHRAFERRVYERADAVLHAIPVQARWARMAYPSARGRIVELCHAAPTRAMETLSPDRSAPGTLSVRAVGTIGDQPALELARAVRALRDAGRAVELRLVGSNPVTLPAIRETLGDALVVTGRLRHDLAQRQIAGADLLVSFLSPERAELALVSSKLFEFVSARTPIVHVNPSSPDRHLAHQLPPTVRCLRRPSQTELVAALEWGLSEQTRDAARDPDHMERFAARFGWDAHARALADALDRATAGSGG